MTPELGVAGLRDRWDPAEAGLPIPQSGRSTMPVPTRSRFLSVVAAAGLAVVLNASLLAAPAQAAARPHAVAQIAVSATKVKAGRTVQITGRLTERGKAVKRTVVRVQKRVHGSTKWVTLATRRTDSAGRISLRSTKLTRSHDFRLAWAGDTTAAPTTSTAVSVSALQQVGITSVSDLHPTAGDVVTISGAAYPGIVDRRAYLQLATSSGWRSVASTRVPTSGAFTVTVRSMRGGEQQYRFLVVGDEGVLPAQSAPQTFEVYAWYRLVDQNPLASTSFFGGAQPIGGTVYEDSESVALAPRTAAYVDYDLGYQCRLLRTTFGPTDDSADGFSARFTAKVDDARPIDMVLAKGATWSETAEISGGQTLRLTSFAVTGEGTAAWGDAEVLCVGRP